MRLLSVLLYVILLPGMALAGAWPRPEGSSFVALSFTGSAEIADLRARAFAMDRFAAVYAEYGLTPRLTVGVDAGVAQNGGRKVLVFARLPVLENTGPTVFAIKAGLGQTSGASGSGPLAAIGLDIGRGISTRFGDGWLGLESWIQHRAATNRTSIKVDLNAGLQISDRIKVMIQLQAGAAPGADPTLRLVPSVVHSVNKTLSVEFGLGADLLGEPKVAIKLGTWIEF